MPIDEQTTIDALKYFDDGTERSPFIATALARFRPERYRPDQKSSVMRFWHAATHVADCSVQSADTTLALTELYKAMLCCLEAIDVGKEKPAR